MEREIKLASDKSIDQIEQIKSYEKDIEKTDHMLNLEKEQNRKINLDQSKALKELESVKSNYDLERSTDKMLLEDMNETIVRLEKENTDLKKAQRHEKNKFDKKVKEMYEVEKIAEDEKENNILLEKEQFRLKICEDKLTDEQAREAEKAGKYLEDLKKVQDIHRKDFNKLKKFENEIADLKNSKEILEDELQSERDKHKDMEADILKLGSDLKKGHITINNLKEEISQVTSDRKFFEELAKKLENNNQEVKSKEMQEAEEIMKELLEREKNLKAKLQKTDKAYHEKDIVINDLKLKAIDLERQIEDDRKKFVGMEKSGNNIIETQGEKLDEEMRKVEVLESQLRGYNMGTQDFSKPHNSKQLYDKNNPNAKYIKDSNNFANPKYGSEIETNPNYNSDYNNYTDTREKPILEEKVDRKTPYTKSENNNPKYEEGIKKTPYGKKSESYKPNYEESSTRKTPYKKSDSNVQDYEDSIQRKTTPHKGQEQSHEDSGARRSPYRKSDDISGQKQGANRIEELKDKNKMLEEKLYNAENGLQQTAKKSANTSPRNSNRKNPNSNLKQKDIESSNRSLSKKGRDPNNRSIKNSMTRNDISAEKGPFVKGPSLKSVQESKKQKPYYENSADRNTNNLNKDLYYHKDWDRDKIILYRDSDKKPKDIKNFDKDKNITSPNNLTFTLSSKSPQFSPNHDLENEEYENNSFQDLNTSNIIKDSSKKIKEGYFKSPDKSKPSLNFNYEKHLNFSKEDLYKSQDSLNDSALARTAKLAKKSNADFHYNPNKEKTVKASPRKSSVGNNLNYSEVEQMSASNFKAVGWIMLDPLQLEVYCQDIDYYKDSVLEVHIGKRTDSIQSNLGLCGKSITWNNQKIKLRVNGEDTAQIYIFNPNKRTNELIGTGRTNLLKLLQNNTRGIVTINLFKDEEPSGRLKLKYDFTQDLKELHKSRDSLYNQSNNPNFTNEKIVRISK